MDPLDYEFDWPKPDPNWKGVLTQPWAPIKTPNINWYPLMPPKKVPFGVITPVTPTKPTKPWTELTKPIPRETHSFGDLKPPDGYYHGPKFVTHGPSPADLERERNWGAARQAYEEWSKLEREYYDRWYVAGDMPLNPMGPIEYLQRYVDRGRTNVKSMNYGIKPGSEEAWHKWYNTNSSAPPPDHWNYKEQPKTFGYGYNKTNLYKHDL